MGQLKKFIRWIGIRFTQFYVSGFDGKPKYIYFQLQELKDYDSYYGTCEYKKYLNGVAKRKHS